MRLVRGGQKAASGGAQQGCSPDIPQTTPTTDFTIQVDGTVTHKTTGLMWKQCLEYLSGSDCATGNASTFTWQQALQLAEDHSFAGHSDWRLPNIKELASIVELGCWDPAINLSVFPNDPGSNVWTNSPYAGSDITMIVDFNSGGDKAGGRNIYFSVRLVRGGQ